MPRPIGRTALMTLSVLAVAATATPAAQADWAPQNAPVTYTDVFVFIRYSGNTIACEMTSSGVNPPARNSSLSLTTTFARCEDNALGIAVNAVCRGSKTLPIRLFAPPSGSGTGTLDANFNCTFFIPQAFCSVTVQGPQVAGAFDFTNRTQTLRETFDVIGTDNGGFCSGNTAGRTNRGNVVFTAISTPNIFITVS